MNGTMMRQPLLISGLLTHAERHHGKQEVVSRRVEGDVHRYTYRDLAQRSRRIANALAAQGILRADRVATLAWNGHRHLELCYAVSGSGSVLHSMNPRLRLDQLVWISHQAQDRMLFFDLSFLPLVEALAARMSSIEAFVAMTDKEHMPAAGCEGLRLLCYEDLIDAHSGAFDWPSLDEHAASALCYAAVDGGTPRGVLSSHRSTLLQAFAATQPDAFGCSAHDVVLAAVPMSRVNAWSLPCIACMVGARLVLPGPWLDGQSLHMLLESEGVTVLAALPSSWHAMLVHVEAHGLNFGKLRRVILDGSSPSATMGRPEQFALAADRRIEILSKHGRPVFGVEMKIVDKDGRELPRDGMAQGDLMVRGPWVSAGYYKGEEGAALIDGWFPTGEKATIHPHGLLEIVTRQT